MNNSALCYEVTERVVQHIVHCTESQGRHVEYLRLLQTLVKAEGQSIRKTQDMVMAEVIVLLSAVLFMMKNMQRVFVSFEKFSVSDFSSNNCRC